MIVDGININCNENIDAKEVQEYIRQEKEARPNLTLIGLDIKIKNDDVLLTPHYDTIVRVRRITGYLSNVKNFNSAKQHEQSDRVKHL